ncbi:uncharacterized protein [Musca autumnalis]|uniref:uncharacterized protein n=1 Tax=Musca autumnalis TaxID=221902 RepID=UPI003CF50223
MNKLSLVILICCFAMIFADLPDWFPQNQSEIEAKCKEESSISPESLEKIWTKDIEDTTEVRSFLLCLAQNKNVFSTEMGYKADRLQLVMKERGKLDCDMEFVEGCVNKSKDVKPDDVMTFDITKCMIDGVEEHCKKVE